MFDFPLAPGVGDEYTLNGVSYVWTGETWDVKSTTTAMTDYVLKVGDVMTGALTLPVPPPTGLQHATHKQYVDEAIARQSLYQSAWQVAANVPDLTPAVVNALHNYSWVASTVDPNVPETALAALPGIGGTLIATNDTIIWNANLSLYEHLPSPAAVTAYLPLVGGAMTGPITSTSSIDADGHIQSVAGIYANGGNSYARAGGKFQFNNTDNNAWQNAISFNGGFHIQYHQGGNNDGRLRFFTANGGYSDLYVFETTIASGGPGIIVNGNVSAASLTARSGHIQAMAYDGQGIQFYGAAYIYKKIGTGMTLRKHTGDTQWGIENNDGGGRVNIATTTLLTTVEAQIEERIDPLLARIATLEAEIAALKAQPRRR